MNESVFVQLEVFISKMSCIFDCVLCACIKTALVITVLFFLWKVYMKLTTGVYNGSKRMVGKTVIVTGANTGIGKETARDLARRGAKVILACRDLARGCQARDEIVCSTGNNEIFVHHLDLASLTSVRDFAHEMITTEEHIDVLINNAGAGGLGNRKTQDGIQLGMQVNHFGGFLLTNLLVDLLKKSAPSRIIFVSSLAHRYAKFDIDNLNFEKDFTDIQVYCYSKLCNVLFANELSRKLSGTGVTVNSLHPGTIHTDIFRHMPPWALRISEFITTYFCKTAVEGAQTTIYLAVAEEVEGVTGKHFSDCKEAKMSALAQDEGLAKKLWEKSEDLVNLKNN